MQNALLIVLLVSGCVAIHSIGISVGVSRLRALSHRRKQMDKRLPAGVILTATVTVLLVLHFLQVILWAVAYRSMGFFASLSEAIYFSAASYSTVGYGDVVIDSPGRIFGPIEAMTGVLMFGWSTGVIVLIATRIYTDIFSDNGSETQP